MQADFWQSRWQEGRIGFHNSEVNPLLTQYFPTLNLKKGSRILVPLSGKSLDMAWLAQQGYDVIGIELVESAVKEFFAEQNLTPTITQPVNDTNIKLYRAKLAGQTIELWVADIFAITPKDIGQIEAVYDRAALIALPETMRSKYSQKITKLSRHNQKAVPQLLITIHYDQSKRDGPPFSISHEQVQQYYNASYQITELTTEDSSLNSAATMTVTEQVWLLTQILD